ncbi:MAG: alpha/beta hydrolase [Bacteroidetes bacterium]|nr:alpha/beta hydrolase [Bacteroidota bacterium]
MKLSILLKNTNLPILILQGSSDHQTKMDFLTEEIDVLGKQNIALEIFNGASHVKLYQDDNFKEQYELLVSEFIRSKK